MRGSAAYIVLLQAFSAIIRVYERVSAVLFKPSPLFGFKNFPLVSPKPHA
jgi:hypothetical protein